MPAENPDAIKVIIVAAGRGQRMGTLTADRPKCMLSFDGRPLVDWQLAALRAAGLHEITVVGGYLSQLVKANGANMVTNPDWADTNMVFSLMCARDVFLSGTPVVVAYADIVYEPRIVSALVSSQTTVATVVDRDWLDLWRVRFDDPLDDAETLRVSDRGAILDIGRKPERVEEIEGQYVGLTYFSAAGAARFAETHRSIGQWEAGKSMRDCYFTDVLRALISQGVRVDAVMTDGGWLEFDSGDDLGAYQNLLDRGDLARFWSHDGIPQA